MDDYIFLGQFSISYYVLSKLIVICKYFYTFCGKYPIRHTSSELFQRKETRRCPCVNEICMDLLINPIALLLNLNTSELI